MKTFDGGLYGLAMFFSIQLQRLHFSRAFLKEQLSDIFLRGRPFDFSGGGGGLGNLV